MDFVLVGVLLTVLFAALVELGLTLYVRNMATAAAGLGARYAANADVGCAAAVARTYAELRATMPVAVSPGGVACTPAAPGGVVEVTVTVRPPAFGWAGAAAFAVHGHARKEG